MDKSLTLHFQRSENMKKDKAAGGNLKKRRKPSGRGTGSNLEDCGEDDSMLCAYCGEKGHCEEQCGKNPYAEMDDYNSDDEDKREFGFVEADDDDDYYSG